ncbi:hypothetical protein [Massilia sp. S19_KUP03_FR1]|uniref:hypothetical protein n=1 Tax=Massilia sp. S19_KUP03_FR1 TaxID=3025503 RepID=UPI002FCDDD15
MLVTLRWPVHRLSIITFENRKNFTFRGNRLLGTTTLISVGIVAPAISSTTATNWWVGDLAGILVVTPFLLSWRVRAPPSRTHTLARLRAGPCRIGDFAVAAVPCTGRWVAPYPGVCIVALHCPMRLRLPALITTLLLNNRRIECGRGNHEFIDGLDAYKHLPDQRAAYLGVCAHDPVLQSFNSSDRFYKWDGQTRIIDLRFRDLGY